MAVALTRGGARVVATLEGRSERTARLARARRLGAASARPERCRPRSRRRSLDRAARAQPAPSPKPSLRAARERVRAAAPRRAERDRARNRSRDPACGVRGTRRDGGRLDLGTAALEARHDARLSLGAARPEVAALPLEGVDRIVVGDEVGAASAVKMSTASVYKGTAALLLQALRRGACERRPRARRRGSAGRRARAGRERRAAPRERGGEVGPLRRRDARDRRDPVGRGAHARSLRGAGRVYAALAETPAARRAPEEIPEVESLEQLLRDLREA